MDALSILGNAYPEGLHSIIVDVIDVVLKYVPVLPPHAIYQLKLQLFLKVGATFRSADGISHRVTPVHLGPSPELFHGHTLH